MSVMTAPPIPAELDQILRHMRMPYLRKAAPDVLATAKAQRWDPAEVLRVLIGEEVVGRDAATRRMRRKSAAFPTGKPSPRGGPKNRPSPNPPNRHCPHWNGSAGTRTSPSPGPAVVVTLHLPFIRVCQTVQAGHV